MNINIYKKLGLGIVLAGSLMMSANAACDSLFCIGGNVGIGAVYSDFGGNGSLDGNFKGGYGAFDIDFLVLRRLQFGLGFKVGPGSMGVFGTNAPSEFYRFIAGNTGYFANAQYKMGFNVASLNSPLYINFVFGIEGHFGAIGHAFGSYGAELEGKKTLTQKAKLLYSFGGGAVRPFYVLKESKQSFSENKLGYGLFGSLGVDVSLTSMLGIYVKGIIKYYNVPQSNALTINSKQVNFPAAHAWSVMLETGLSF